MNWRCVVRFLFFTPQVTVFRHRKNRPGPDRGLCPAQGHDRPGNRTMARAGAGLRGLRKSVRVGVETGENTIR